MEKRAHPFLKRWKPHRRTWTGEQNSLRPVLGQLRLGPISSSAFGAAKRYDVRGEPPAGLSGSLRET